MLTVKPSVTGRAAQPAALGLLWWWNYEVKFVYGRSWLLDFSPLELRSVPCQEEWWGVSKPIPQTLFFNQSVRCFPQGTGVQSALTYGKVRAREGSGKSKEALPWYPQDPSYICPSYRRKWLPRRPSSPRLG